ncbi:MAG: hypothetical protein QM763_13295 [Agriterribacter sp.]
MKKTVCLFAFVIICTFSFGQNNDLQAQYLYSKAEDSYAKNQFADAVNLCEQAAEKLGQTNQKILFLELEAYGGLLTQKCGDPLLDNKSKIDGYFDLYLNKLSNGADNEKIITIMKFKDQWADYKANGCPALTYTDLHLGLKFVDTNSPEVFTKKMVRFWEITEITNTALKTMKGTASKVSVNFYNSKMSYKDVDCPVLAIGFLAENIYLSFPSSTTTGVTLKANGYSDDVTYSASEIESAVNAWLKKEAVAKHVSDKIHVTLSGHFSNETKTSNIYSFDLPLHN